MLNKSHKSISTKESLLFCFFSGSFLYGLLSLPLILFKLFPPTQPEGFSITYGVFTAPNKYAFTLSFILFTILGIYLLRKLSFANRVAHYLLLATILSISGMLTSIIETVYLSFIIDNYSIIEIWQEFKLSIFYGLVLLFSIIIIPFTALFLFITFFFTKFKARKKLV